jgi:hypothetical protein
MGGIKTAGLLPVCRVNPGIETGDSFRSIRKVYKTKCNIRITYCVRRGEGSVRKQRIFLITGSVLVPATTILAGCMQGEAG